MNEELMSWYDRVVMANFGIWGIDDGEYLKNPTRAGYKFMAGIPMRDLRIKSRRLMREVYMAGEITGKTTGNMVSTLKLKPDATTECKIEYTAADSVPVDARFRLFDVSCLYRLSSPCIVENILI